MDTSRGPPKVKNKAAAPVQISAEQLLREAVDRQEVPIQAPTQRFADLGQRWLAPAGEPAEGWLAHRLRLGVCEGDEVRDLLWLECNAVELNGVSFTKGCFVGQENTARMNWRQKVNRRLFVVDGVREGARATYPELGLSVVHARIDAVPDGAILPDWLRPALSAPSA